MSKNTVRLIYASIAAATIIAIAFLTLHRDECTIDPPQTQSKEDREAIVKFAGKFGDVDGTPTEVEASFRRLVDENHQQLSDANACLLLELRAIDCYLKHGKVGEEIARQMVEMIYRRTMSQHKIAGVGEPTQIKPLELLKLRDSLESDEIIKRLEDFGYKQI